MGKKCKHTKCNNHTIEPIKSKFEMKLGCWILNLDTPYERRRRKKVLHGLKYFT
jgi:hypothetical protein